jgi:hypothetical protein
MKGPTLLTFAQRNLKIIRDFRLSLSLFIFTIIRTIFIRSYTLHFLEQSARQIINIYT